MINFSDLSFIFRFLPAFLLAYYIVPIGMRAYITVIGSLIFYAVGDIKSLWVFLASIVVNYLFSLKCQERKKAFLFVIVLFDTGLLVFYKLIAQRIGLLLPVPLGISFFTFKMISFQADLYTGKIKKRPRFMETLLYFSLFPQVISGPIMRFEDTEKNRIITGVEDRFLLFRDRFSKNFDKVEEGLSIFVMGFAMKVILADYLAMMWNEIGTIGYESISTPLAWAGVVCYSLELYFDFWGYSLMASGIAVAMGYPFIINFNHPYSAKGVGDFYRRWHVTLGTWFRDYIYIPMGGSKKGSLRTIFNLCVVWFLTGLWHGVTLNFLLWSGCLLVLIVLEKYLWVHIPKVRDFVGKVHVLFFIPITWVIFAIPNYNDLLNYLGRLFPFAGGGNYINPFDFDKIVGNYVFFLLTGMMLLWPKIFDYIFKNRRNWFVRLFLLILFWICAVFVSGKAGNPFLYFSF